MDELKQFWQLYESTFPDNERRSVESQSKIMQLPEFTLTHYKEQGKYAGFMCWYNFPSFYFIEYLAVSSAMRGQGFGSKVMLDFMESVRNDSKGIILEVERHDGEFETDKNKSRRIKYYEALGFCLNTFDYVQPPIDKGLESIPLYLMSCPEPLLEEEYKAVRRELYCKIYNCAD